MLNQLSVRRNICRTRPWNSTAVCCFLWPPGWVATQTPWPVCERCWITSSPPWKRSLVRCHGGLLGEYMSRSTQEVESSHVLTGGGNPTHETWKTGSWPLFRHFWFPLRRWSIETGVRMRCLQTRRLARIAPPVWRPSRRRSAQFHLFYILLSDLIMVQESKHFQLKTPKLSDLILLCFSGGFEDRMWNQGVSRATSCSHHPMEGGLSWEPGGQAGRGDHGTGKPTIWEPGETQGETGKGSLNFQGFPRDFPNISREFWFYSIIGSNITFVFC